MKAEVKAQWVAALRSGEYAQTKGRLRDGSGYCCLGVLCEVAVKEGVIGKPTQGADGNFRYPGGHRGRPEGGVLPRAVQEWAGLDSDNPVVDGYTLVWLNDFEGWDFEQLADLIDRGL